MRGNRSSRIDKKSLTDRTAGELTNTKWRICHWRRPLGIQIKSSRAEPPLTQGLGQAKVMIDHVVLIMLRSLFFANLREVRTRCRDYRGSCKSPDRRLRPSIKRYLRGLIFVVKFDHEGATALARCKAIVKQRGKSCGLRFSSPSRFKYIAFFVSQRPVACRLEGKPEAAELTTKERMIQQFRMLLDQVPDDHKK